MWLLIDVPRMAKRLLLIAVVLAILMLLPVAYFRCSPSRERFGGSTGLSCYSPDLVFARIKDVLESEGIRVAKPVTMLDERTAVLMWEGTASSGYAKLGSIGTPVMELSIEISTPSWPWDVSRGQRLRKRLMDLAYYQPR